MKKKLMMCAIVGLTSINLAYADMTFRFKNNRCDTVSGAWVGVGKASNWLTGTCVYNGHGTAGSMDGAGNFFMHALGDKKSGSALCPKHFDNTLLANCTNGKVILRTEYGNINGSVNGNKGSATGTVKVTKGIEADVTIDIDKV